MTALLGILFASFFWYVGLRGFITALDLTMRGSATTGTVMSIVRDIVVLPTRLTPPQLPDIGVPSWHAGARCRLASHERQPRDHNWLYRVGAFRTYALKKLAEEG